MESEKTRVQCRRLATATLVLLASLIPSSLGYAAVRAVPSGYPTIQAGIDAAVEGDSVVIAAGTFHERLRLVGKNITLLGDGPDLTIISGAMFPSDSLSILYVDQVDDRTLITGITFRDNLAVNYRYSAGGGINCDWEAGPRIEGNAFRNNRAFYGGGVATTFCQLPVYIRNNIFVGNRSADGAGVDVAFCDAAVVVENNYFEGNVAEGYNMGIGQGGGLNIEYGFNRTIARSNVFYKNRAGYAGGAATYASVGHFFGNTFAFNEAYVGTTSAGNLRCYGSLGDTMIAIGNIIANAVGGAGVQVVGAPVGPPVVQLDCNDFWQNQNGDFATFAASVSHGPNDFSMDPQFCNPLSGNLSLASGSPCLPENNPTCGLVGALGMGCAEVAGVDDLNRPGAREILGVIARRGEDVQFLIDAEEAVAAKEANLQIFDLQGRAIRRLDASTGLRTGGIRWDRRNDSGSLVPTGVYFARLDAGNLRGSASFVLVR